MTSSSFDSSTVIPCESTPLGRVSSGGPVPQAKKKSSRSFFQVVVPLFLVCLGITVYSRLSSLDSSSSVVDQSVSKSVNKVQIENDSIVFPIASLAASESKTSLRQVATGKSTIDTDDRRNDVSPTTSLTEVIDTPHFLTETLLTLKFPLGVFEDTPENRNNARYMFGILGRCNDAINKSDREVLACEVYERVSDLPLHRVKMALGTIKTGADILDISINGDLKVEDVTLLFVDHAVAVMIDRECFTWSSGDAKSHQEQYKYNSENDYSIQVAKSESIDVSTSGGYGPVTVSAGYKHAKSSSSTSSTKTTTATGYKKFWSSIGSIENNCLNNKEDFQLNIKDLVKPEWTERWKRIRKSKSTTVAQIISMGDDFVKVADGGFFIPSMYNYEATLTYTVKATYSSSDASQAEAASNGISAGLSVSFLGAHGSASTTIDNAMNQSSTGSSYTGTFESYVDSDGADIDQTCLLTNSCPTQLVNTVNKINSEGGLSNLDAHASSISSFTTLDNIIEWYFDSNTGLPDRFPAAVAELVSNPYIRQGTVCWAYDFDDNGEFLMENKHNCWTTNKNIVPTGINENYDLITPYFWKGVGAIVSPHPTSCCNPCERTYHCSDAKCQRTLDKYSIDVDSSLVAPLVHDACRA